MRTKTENKQNKPKKQKRDIIKMYNFACFQRAKTRLLFLGLCK